MTIWITQWLCAQRHCSIALAWDDTSDNAGGIVAKGEQLYASGAINRYCGICGGDLTPEHGRTKWQTLDEAVGPIAEVQQLQISSREMMDNLGMTVEKSQPPNQN